MGKKQSLPVVDMHCHILPGIDDGSKDIIESLKMLEIAQKDGITHIVCTPHYKNHRKNVTKEELVASFIAFKKKAKEEGSDVELYLGNEVFYFGELGQAVDDDKICSMNDGEFMLVEFHPGDSYHTIRNGLDDVLGLGFVPILAHVERYECINRHIDNVAALRRMGIKIQVNAASIEGKYGSSIKHFVHHLLKNKMVDYVSTDAHGSESRSPQIKKCRDILMKKYDKEYAQALLYGNALRDFELEL